MLVLNPVENHVIPIITNSVINCEKYFVSNITLKLSKSFYTMTERSWNIKQNF